MTPKEEAAAGHGPLRGAGSLGAGVCGGAGRHALPHAIKPPGCLACSSPVSTVSPDVREPCQRFLVLPSAFPFPFPAHPLTLELRAQTLSEPRDPVPGTQGVWACLWWRVAPTSPSLPALSPALPPQAAGAGALAWLHRAGQHRPWCETSLLDTSPSLVRRGPVGMALWCCPGPVPTSTRSQLSPWGEHGWGMQVTLLCHGWDSPASQRLQVFPKNTSCQRSYCLINLLINESPERGGGCR